MALLSCNITIEGYWREMNRQFIPNYAGIFFVYQASYNDKEDIISPVTLVFIGHALKVREMIQQYITSGSPWHRFAKAGHEFCYSSAYLSEVDLERVVSAFIFEFKPEANTQYVDFFTYDPTTVKVTGKTALLKTSFTVQKTPL